MTTAQDRAQAEAVMTELLTAHGMDEAQARELAPKVIASAVAARDGGHQQAATWDDIAGVVELATVIDLYNPAGNPDQARVPPGQPGAGKFTKGQSQQQQVAKTAHAKHVAHEQHVARQAQQKATLLKQAKQDRAKAAGIMKQITALQKTIAAAQAATGKTVSSSSNVTQATTGSTTAPSASTTAAAASTAASSASSTASSTASTTAKATAASKQIGPLRQQYKNLMASAAKASAQAAKL